jgi:hypothetical protein
MLSVYQGAVYQSYVYQRTDSDITPVVVEDVEQITYAPSRQIKKNPWVIGKQATKKESKAERKVVDISAEVEQLRLLKEDVNNAVAEGKAQEEYIAQLRLKIQEDSDRLKLIKMLEAEIQFRQAEEDELVMLLLLSEV